jgi:hypothetical protein
VEQDDIQPVTAVEKYFFTPLYYPQSAWSVVRWWEKRRLAYNVAVGTAGMVTLAVAALTDGQGPPFMLPLVYGVIANIFYTMGPVADLAMRKVLGERAPAVGPAMFRYGFAFAVGLTLLPVPLFIFSWIVRHLIL